MKVSGTKDELIKRILQYKPDKLFIQPFPENYGLDSSGNPIDEFKKFIQSDQIIYVHRLHIKFSNDQDGLNQFLEHINIFSSVCLGNIIFQHFDGISEINTRNMLKESHLFFKYLFGVDEEKDLNIDRILIPVTILEETYKALNEMYSVKNKFDIKVLMMKILDFLRPYKYEISTLLKQESDIKRCFISDKKLIRIAINLRFGRMLPRHTVQVLVNLDSMRAQVVDTITLTRDIDALSIESYLKLFDDKINLDLYDIAICPEVGFQIANLCATWSVYLFILHILNDLSFVGIRDKMIKLDENERTKMILQYMFFIYNLVF